MADAELCQHCRLRPPSRKGRPYCSKACSNGARKRPATERFLDYYKPGRPDECWPWRGSIDKDGYGYFASDDRTRQLRAHRTAFELAGGVVPPGRHVLHLCDNPPCCNPSHLFVGTNLDNIADKVSKGRARGWPKGKPRRA